MSAAMVGHEYRQDDLPAVAASPDGSLWITWLSFVGDRDDVVIRHYAEGRWSNLQWVPGTSQRPENARQPTNTRRNSMNVVRPDQMPTRPHP